MLPIHALNTLCISSLGSWDFVAGSPLGLVFRGPGISCQVLLRIAWLPAGLEMELDFWPTGLNYGRDRILRVELFASPSVTYFYDSVFICFIATLLL